MNYSQLTTAITDHLEEIDEASFTAQIPNFVTGAEQTIYRHIDLPSTRFLSDGAISCVAGTATITPPSDWLEIFSVALKEAGSGDNETKVLYRRDPTYILEAYPVAATQAEPRDYALYNDASILLGPTPDDTYPLLIHYKKFPETIVTASTTWLGDNAEQALLFGSIYNAYIFLKGEPDLLQEYGRKFLNEMQALGYEGDALPGDVREVTT